MTFEDWLNEPVTPRKKRRDMMNERDIDWARIAWAACYRDATGGRYHSGGVAVPLVAHHGSLMAEKMMATGGAGISTLKNSDGGWVSSEYVRDIIKGMNVSNDSGIDK